MSRVQLVQPRPGERMSGGYLYNAEMARHGAWDLCNLDSSELATALPNLPADLLIADSIWLTQQTLSPFLDEAARGRRIGVMMHSFPSLITATESGQPPRSEPSAFEMDALARIGLAILPGRHYAGMLAQHGVEALIFNPGIPDDWRHPPRHRQDVCSLVSVGAVTRRKGYLDVLEALRPLARSTDFRWTVVGSLESDPEYAGAVARLAQEFPGVRLAGQMDRDGVRTQLMMSDVLVMPSYDENQPLVLLEAMASSVPSVAYDAGAASQMIEHEKEGLIVPIGDREGLARGLTRLIGHEDERLRMAHACWARQQTLPSWAAAAFIARSILEVRLSTPYSNRQSAIDNRKSS